MLTVDAILADLDIGEALATTLHTAGPVAEILDGDLGLRALEVEGRARAQLGLGRTLGGAADGGEKHEQRDEA